MESEGVAYEASWCSFEELEIMAQLLGGGVATNYFPSDQEQEPTNGMHLMFWPNHDSDSNFSPSTNVDYNSYYWPQSISTPCISTSTSSFLLSNPSHGGGGCYLGDTNLVPHNTTSSLYVDFNGRYCDLPSMTEEACDDNELGLSIANQRRPAVFADEPSHAAKRKFGLGDNEKPIEDVKDDDTSSLVPRSPREMRKIAMPTFTVRAQVRAARRTIQADRRNRRREEATRARDRKSQQLLV